MSVIASMGPDGLPGGVSAIDSLIDKLDAAQKAMKRRQPAVAVLHLQTFIHEVETQKGKRINADSASHLMNHAQTVIDSIVPKNTIQ